MPQVPSHGLWGAIETVCNPVCSDEHLGGGGLGGGGLQAENNKGRVHKAHWRALWTWQQYSSVNKLGRFQLSPQQMPLQLATAVSHLPWRRRRARRRGRAAGGQGWV